MDSDIKPKIYVTNDRDGLHLWFCLGAPQMDGRSKSYHHGMAAAKVRIPKSWYDGIPRDGECKEIDLSNILASKN